MKFRNARDTSIQTPRGFQSFCADHFKPARLCAPSEREHKSIQFQQRRQLNELLDYEVCHRAKLIAFDYHGHARSFASWARCMCRTNIDKYFAMKLKQKQSKADIRLLMLSLSQSRASESMTLANAGIMYVFDQQSDSQFHVSF